MVRASEAIEILGDLASGQWGLLTTAQAHKEGITAQQLARFTTTGLLERQRHGVYRVAGAPPEPDDDIRVAWLALNPHEIASERLAEPGVEVVSHLSAALLHQLGDVDADHLEFTTSHRKQTRDPQIRLHRRTLSPDQWTRAHGLPVTTVITTIDDLAGSRIDGGHLAGVVRDAVTDHHAGVAEVAKALNPHAHHYGAPLGQGAILLQRFLEQAGVPESTHAAGALAGPYTPSESVQRVLNQAIPSTFGINADALAQLHQVAQSITNLQAVLQAALPDPQVIKSIRDQLDLYGSLVNQVPPISVRLPEPPIQAALDDSATRTALDNPAITATLNHQPATIASPHDPAAPATTMISKAANAPPDSGDDPAD